MSFVGLDKVYYAPFTGLTDNVPTYGTPVRLAGAITANLTIERNQANNYGDNILMEYIDKFKRGTISLDSVGLSIVNIAALTGSVIDENGLLVYSTEDTAPYVALGYRAEMGNGFHRLTWIYKVKFGIAAENLQTSGENAAFQNPNIDGVILAPEFTDSRGKHVWRTKELCKNKLCI